MQWRGVRTRRRNHWHGRGADTGLYILQQRALPGGAMKAAGSRNGRPSAWARPGRERGEAGHDGLTEFVVFKKAT
jgi:hypothetical protein